MYCDKCGSQIADNSRMCTVCGAMVTQTPPAQPQPQVNPYQPNPYQPQANPYQPAPAANAQTPGKGMAIAGMVLGILSFLCFPYITGLLGIIFGGVAKSKGYKGGMATAGIVCGVIGLALWLVMLLTCSNAGLYAAMLDL